MCAFTSQALKLGPRSESQPRIQGLPTADGALTLTAHQALRDANQVIVCLGGKAGRLGECVVGTALLEGTLQALAGLGRAAIPVSIIVDEGTRELFDAACYQAHYWPRIRVISAPVEGAQPVRDALIDTHERGTALVLDFNGARDGSPTLSIHDVPSHLPQEGPSLRKRVIVLDQLFRMGVRVYAHRGSLRRYADFIEDLFGLPAGAIDGLRAQPTIWLSADDLARFQGLARTSGLREGSMLIVCSFQSVVPAKCYDRWPEVLGYISREITRRCPGTLVDFLIACGPDELHQEGVRLADLEADFAGFADGEHPARTIVVRTPSLRDLAVLMRHAALVLANDTGPGHIAGALGVPVVTPYLPGNVYSQAVWASSPWHHGVTLDPNPYTQRQVENAVLWNNNTIISQISAEVLARMALRVLPMYPMPRAPSPAKAAATMP